MRDVQERLRDEANEYQQYLKGKPQLLDREDSDKVLGGYLSGFGFHPYHQPVYDKENRITRFPFLDPYWTRAGVIFVRDDDMSEVKVPEFKKRMASCLQEADRRGELNLLLDPRRINNIRAVLERGV